LTFVDAVKNLIDAVRCSDAFSLALALPRVHRVRP